jgi:photosystem II stability/assembly factor-like uncharacterized protein
VTVPARLGVLVVGVLLAAATSAQPHWVELDGSPSNQHRIEDISFPDADTGWSVDGAGRVHRTTDGGATWAQTATLGGYLRSTAFASRDLGWVGVLSSSTKLYEAHDGGFTFADVTGRIEPALEGGVCSLFAVSERVVYGAGQYNGPATLLKTTDGGGTWASSSFAPLLSTAIDVYFFDEQRGLVVGGTGSFAGDAIRPRVIGTEDGGQTWTVRHTADVAPAWGWKLSFPTPEVGYMSIEKRSGSSTAHLLKTTDGGRTWEDLSIPNAGSGSMQGVGFVTPDVGWVSGRGTTSKTTDGGQTWTQIPSSGELDPNVNRFRFVDGGLGFAAGLRIHRLDARGTAEAGPPEAGWGVGPPSPNPAAALVRIGYRLGRSGPVRVEVLDVLGRRVATLVDGVEGAGERSVEWTAGPGTAPGLYLVRLQAAGRQWTRRFAVAR